MTTVYRYEHPETRKGPYNGDLADINAEHKGWESSHPSWQMDGMSSVAYAVGDRYYSGCDSLESLAAWFKGWEDKLTEAGYVIMGYEVPAEYVKKSMSGKQIAFDRSKARCIGPVKELSNA